METSRKARISAQIVAAYVSKNHVARPELAGVVEMVITTLDRLSGQAAEIAQEPEPQVPAVPVKKSIEPDFLICLEDGKRFRSLKRHLSTKFGLTPDEYRRKWGLPVDYPMVAPNYAAARSEMAKSMGLGRKASAPEPEPAPEPAAQPAPKARGRKPAGVKAAQSANDSRSDAKHASAEEGTKAAKPRRRAPRKAKTEA